MICADDEAGRRQALAKMLPMQRSDFEALFEIMAGLPVTIRLLDPPLHEFLPHEEKEAHGRRQGARRAARQAEGPRGTSCTSSTRCWASAAAGSPSATPRSPRCRRAPSSRRPSMPRRKTGKPVIPEVMIPLVAYRAEFDLVREAIVKTARAVEAETGAKLDYQIGTMIELPRACLKAERDRRRRGGRRVLLVRHQRPHPDLPRPVARRCRADPRQLRRAGDPADRPVRLHRPGRRGRARPHRHRARPQGAARPQGRHLRRARRRSGLVAFCHETGLDYVSCSAFRVPVARLAAAQAAIRAKRGGEAAGGD